MSMETFSLLSYMCKATEVNVHKTVTPKYHGRTNRPSSISSLMSHPNSCCHGASIELQAASSGSENFLQSGVLIHCCTRSKSESVFQHGQHTCQQTCPTSAPVEHLQQKDGGRVRVVRALSLESGLCSHSKNVYRSCVLLQVLTTLCH